MSAELLFAHETRNLLSPVNDDTLIIDQQSRGGVQLNSKTRILARVSSLLGLLGLAAMILGHPQLPDGTFRIGVSVARQHPAVVGLADESRLQMPRGRNSTGTTCSYSFLRFKRDLETFTPPLWKYDSYLENCIKVMRGSGSWREYAFTTEEDCLAQCGPQPANNTQEQLGPDPQKAECFAKGPLGAGVGARCVFPFTYKDTTYTSCTTRDDGEKLWCATQVDGKGETAPGFWGECVCVNMPANESLERQPSTEPPWWIVHDVTPAGPLKDMGTWKAVTFSEDQQNVFGVDQDGAILNHSKFDVALAALIALPPPSLPPPLGQKPSTLSPSVKPPPLIGGDGGIPPWWILHRIEPAGPIRDMGSWNATTFSKEQQKKYGCDVNGTIINQERFMKAILTKIKKPSPVPTKIKKPLPVPPRGIPAVVSVGLGGKSDGLCSYDSLNFTRDMQRYITPLWKYDNATGQCVAVRQGSGSWRKYGWLSKEECSMKCSPPMKGPSTDESRCSAEDIAGAGAGAMCVFPFKYKGILYNECTSKDSDSLWCSTQVDSEGKYLAGLWGKCSCVSMTKDTAVEGQPPALPPWWILHDVVPEGPLKDMGTWNASTFSKEQRDRFGIDENGYVLNHTKFDLALASVMMMPLLETEGLQIPWYVLHGVIPEGLPSPQGFGNVSFSKEQQAKFGIKEDGDIVDQAAFKKAIASLGPSSMPPLPPPPPPLPLAGNLSNFTIPGALTPIIVDPMPSTNLPGLPPWWILHQIEPEGPKKVMGSSTAVSFSKEQQKTFGVDEDGNIVDMATFVKAIKAVDLPNGLPPLPPAVNLSSLNFSGKLPPPLPPAGNFISFNFTGTVPPLMLDKLPTVGPGGIPPWWILHGVKPEGPEKNMGKSTSISFSKKQQLQFGIDEDGNIVDEATFTKAIVALDLPTLPPLSLPSNLITLNLSGTLPPIIVDPPPIVGPSGIPPWWILHRVRPEGPKKVMGNSTAISFSKEQQKQFGIDEAGNVVNNAKFQDAMMALTAPAA